MKPSYIKAVGLTKSFLKGQQEITPVKELSFEVDESEFISLMGPSGSGKTTLLNLLGGIDSPTAGNLFVGGQALHDMNREQLTQWRSNEVGYVFQLYHLMPVLTAFENVELPLLLQNLKKKTGMNALNQFWNKLDYRTGKNIILGNFLGGRNSELPSLGLWYQNLH